MTITTCNHQGCDKPYDIENQSRYRQPLRLCGKHYNELERMAVGSQAERMFLYRCGIIRDEAIDETVDRLIQEVI